MLCDEILLLASLLETGQATEAEQRNASIVAQKIAAKARRMERTLDEMVSEAMADAALPVSVPPVAKIIAFPRRVPADEAWR